MDEADRADQEINAGINEALWMARQQAKAAPAFRPKGACHYCDEAVDGKLLFCDKECEECQRMEDEQLKRLGR